MKQAEETRSGRAFFEAGPVIGSYGEKVLSSDLIAANFDVCKVHSGGGLYLLEAKEGGEWRGCRLMMTVPNGVDIDQSGRGDWLTVPSMEATAFRVVGVIERVYH